MAPCITLKLAEEESLIESRPCSKTLILVQEQLDRSKSRKDTETDDNLKSTSSTSSKRTQPEHLSPNHLNIVNKKN